LPGEIANSSAIATTFESPDSGFPEPLIPFGNLKAIAVLLSFLAQGYSCPRKVLINSDTHAAKCPAARRRLTNVNTPEELERVKAIDPP
jgi:molybdopterin-guanine dinucleotide biosynthesis protein A